MGGPKGAYQGAIIEKISRICYYYDLCLMR